MVAREKDRALTYLENGFPTQKLHELALKEGNSKRPIYQIHKWWARRLGSVFRALILSSSLPPSESEEGFWKKYGNSFSVEGLTLYDPMMGGGSSIVEGLKLGYKVIGADVNPVAWFVTKKEVELFDEKSIDLQFDLLEKNVGRRIQDFYKTRCNEKHEAEIVYAIWIRQISCKQCGKSSDLFTHYVIRQKEREGIVTRTIVCPKCMEVSTISSDSITESTECPKCKETISLESSILDRGVFHCPACGQVERETDAAKRKGSPLDSRMFAIEYWCSTCKTLGFKRPDDVDLSLYARTKSEFEAAEHLLYPRQRIVMEGRSDRRPISHGFHHYYELFNPRQLLCLSMLIGEISKIADQSAREFLLLTFSSSLETNNALCKYETNWGKVSALFGIPGYHVPERYGENNLWGRGRGSFVRAYHRLKRGKAYAEKPFEIQLALDADYSETEKQKRRKKIYGTKNILTKVSHSDRPFSPTEKRPRILCRDSRKANFLPDKSIDLVLSDPPYYDNLVYSELADFFYVWLRLVLRQNYKFFESESSRRRQEIVVNERSEKGEAEFVSNLTKVLLESKRVLKDNGMVVFTFHHSNPHAWIGLKKAITDSGLTVTASPVIRSEGKTGYRKGNISYDICIVCRKRLSGHSNEKTTVEAFIESASTAAKSLHIQDEKINDSDILTVLMGEYLRMNGSVDEEFVAKPYELIELIRSRLPVSVPNAIRRETQTIPSRSFALRF